MNTYHIPEDWLYPHVLVSGFDALFGLKGVFTRSRPMAAPVASVPTIANISLTIEGSATRRALTQVVVDADAGRRLFYDGGGDIWEPSTLYERSVSARTVILRFVRT